ncbi:two-component system sensor histidine kinase KdbD, partial [Escherichia coli]|nr:two-component system sensor histidine kinase KdbD [Escherichia coli]
EQRTRHLFEMTRELGRAVTLQDVVRTSYHFLSSAFDAKVCLLLPNKQGELTPFHAQGMEHLPIDNAIARWCCDKDQIAGAGTDTLPSVPYQL